MEKDWGRAVGDDKEPHAVAPMEKVLYVRKGCDRPHFTHNEARNCDQGEGGRYAEIKEVTFYSGARTIYLVTEDDYDNGYDIIAATSDRDIVTDLLDKKIGDSFMELTLYSKENPPEVRRELTLSFAHWMIQNARAAGEPADNAAAPLPEGDRPLVVTQWREHSSENAHMKDILITPGDEETLACRVHRQVHRTGYKREGINLHVTGIDHVKVRETYEQIKAEHLKMWEGGE
jgi:hypothetical protein